MTSLYYATVNNCRSVLLGIPRPDSNPEPGALGSDAAASAAIFLGQQALRAGAARQEYAKAAASLSADDSLARKALKNEFRNKTPSLFRELIRVLRPGLDAPAGTGGRAYNTNAGWNSAGTAVKHGGRILIVGAVAQQALEISSSSTPTREVAGAGGMILGSIVLGEGGAAAGIAIGAFLGGPPGALIGGILGGVGGGTVGGLAGEQGAEALYDYTRPQ